VDLFALLERVSQRSQGEALPGWLLTHPEPGARREEAEKVVRELDLDRAELRLNRDTFLRHLDGMVYGSDPRQGYFRNERFFHPAMAFELTFPAGWKTANLRQAVVGQQPDGEAVVTLTLASQRDAESAARALADQGAKPVREWRDRLGGERAVSYYWTADLSGTPAAGLAAFVEHGGNVFRMLAYTTQTAFDRYRGDLEDSLASFDRLEDRRVLAVQPLRLKLERLDRPMTIDRVAKSYDVPIAVEDLALLNNVDPGTELRAGDWVKIVDGERPP
jgi:predicted Zn-dependent protease